MGQLYKVIMGVYYHKSVLVLMTMLLGYTTPVNQQTYNSLQVECIEVCLRPQVKCHLSWKIEGTQNGGREQAISFSSITRLIMNIAIITVVW